MGLFSREKKEQKPESLPPLKFPELPSSMPAEIPAYEHSAMREAAAIKRAVMPREEPMDMSKMMMQMPRKQPMPREMPMQKHEQPLFIKVDAYKEVVDTVTMIKAKLTDAAHILDELTRLKEEEDREIATWHSDLEMVKEKLMLIDQKLSEQ